MTNTFCPCGKEKPETAGQEEKPQSLGPRTDDVYRTCNLPERFMYPRVFKGYRQEEGPQPHPCYRSTSMDYGWYAPTIHTVPTNFYPKNASFSSDLARSGMYRNYSLNTELDKTLF